MALALDLGLHLGSAGIGNNNSDMDTMKQLGPTFAIIGDSITAYNTVRAGQNYTYQSKGYATWLRILSRQAVDFPLSSNFGVGGETLTQIAARFSSVIAARPDFVIIEGGINDVFADATYASMKTAMISMVRSAFSSGIFPVVMVVHPKGPVPGGALTTSQKLNLMRFNNWLREFGKGRADLIADAGLPRGYVPLVCDTWPYLADQTTQVSPIAGSTYDDLHPTDLGGYLAGKALWELLSPIIPNRRTQFSMPGDYYDATTNPAGNLLHGTAVSRGTFAGTGGTINTSTGFTGSGTVADGWAVSKAGGTATTTVTASIESPRTDVPASSGLRQRLQAAMSATGAVRERVQLSSTVAGADISPGDVVFGEIAFEVASSSRLLGIQLQVFDTPNFVSIGIDSSSVAGDPGYGTLPNEVIKGVLRTPPTTVPPSGATGLSLVASIVFDATSGSPAADVYFADAMVRKIIP